MGSCPILYQDDFSVCFRKRYLETLIPILVVTTSISVLVFQYKRLNNLKSKTVENKISADETQPLLTSFPDLPAKSDGGVRVNINTIDANTTSYNSILSSSSDSISSSGSEVTSSSSSHSTSSSGSRSNSKDAYSEKIKLSHFDVTQLYENVETEETKSVIIHRSNTERVLFALEEILLILQASNTAIFQSREKISTSSLVFSSVWLYILILGSIRFFDSSVIANNKLPSLWNHSTSIYTIMLPITAILARSYSKTSTELHFYATFIINLLLVIDNYSINVGDKPNVQTVRRGLTPSPEPNSSLFSIIMFSWIGPLLEEGYKTPLIVSRVWDTKIDDQPLTILIRFNNFKNNAGKKISFIKNIFLYFSKSLFLQISWSIVKTIFDFAPALLLKKFLEFVQNPSSYPNKNISWILISLMLLFTFLGSIAGGQLAFIARHLSMQLRSILISEIYSKSLRLKTVNPTAHKDEENNHNAELLNAPRKESKRSERSKDSEEGSPNMGKIINLMSSDAFSVSTLTANLFLFITSFLKAIIAMFLLYNLLGWSSIIGTFSLIILMPFQYFAFRRVNNAQRSLMKISDQRLLSINEMLQSIRIIKYFSWENNFEEKIMKIRNKEIKYIKSVFVRILPIMFLMSMSSTIVTFVSFGCFIFLAKQRLTTPIAFTSLTLFNLLQEPLMEISAMLSSIVQSKVSLDRIGSFLSEPETDKFRQLSRPPGLNDPLIGFNDDASFSWDIKSNNAFKLKNLNITFKEGKLNIITGPTGSGKTSMLFALLGEMDLISGNVFLPGVQPLEELTIDKKTGLKESVAFCAQTAWLLNDTIKNNILFGSKFIENRYNQVITTCGLNKDLEILTAGDETEIGEKGIALSGGQKQRVSLARALYSHARYLILDDCLSAVDSHTSKWIYNHAITGKLIKNRTVILVTHNIALCVKKASWVVLLENGIIKSQGEPKYLVENGSLGADERLKASLLNNDDDYEDESSENNIKLSDSSLDIKKTIESGKLIKEEDKQNGKVSIEVYKAYIKSFKSWTYLVIMFILLFGSQITMFLSSWWVRAWASKSDNVADSSMILTATTTTVTLIKEYINVPILYYSNNWLNGENSQIYSLSNNNTQTLSTSPTHSHLYYMVIYTLIGVLNCLIMSSRMIFLAFAALDTSNRLFQKLLNRILLAKIRFFDSTPVGRIVNRFSQDISAIDRQVAQVLDRVFSSFLNCLMTLMLIAFITPQFLIVAIVICGSYYFVASYYIVTSRDLKRLNSITRSPIFQHFGETLIGVSTIRAYGDERRFIRGSLSRIDTNNRTYFYLVVSNRWLSIRINLLGAFVVFFSGSLILLNIDHIDAGLAGISLTYAISFSSSAFRLVNLIASLEMTMNSVERIFEYLKIENEEGYKNSEDLIIPRASWPDNGSIDVKNLSLRYAPNLPQVIKNATFNIKSMTKVGIVGRTGAGKSTIITAFFRFLEPETGTIAIDGIDITKISLKDLRQAITIIPQDPTLFNGTIRTNVDPFNEFTDSAIFEALRRVSLIDKVPDSNSSITINNTPIISGEEDGEEDNINQFLNLENIVSDGGSNLSQGQRQLLCLARSLLRSPKIMMLDEATASIDYKTDSKIQRAIRNEFSKSTILTIAHRLKSIIDYDVILVLDQGEVVEYDSPFNLISKDGSIFKSMCEQSGEFSTLLQIAKDAAHQ